MSNYLLEHVPGIERGDVMLHAAPVSHASGSYFLPHLVRGATSVLLPRFRTGEFLEWMERTGAQRTFLVPTMMATLLDEPNLADVALPQLKQISYGASPIAPSVAEGCERVFGQVLAQTYGQAEAPMTITHLRPEEHGRVGSAGRAYTMVAVRVVDALIRRGPGRGRRRDRRGRLPRGDRVVGLLQPARRHRRRRSATAGCTPATSATSTRTATSSCRTGSTT